jgi:hypothetical protein
VLQELAKLADAPPPVAESKSVKLSVAEKLRRAELADEKAVDNSTSPQFVVGDIVNARPKGESLFFEGVRLFPFSHHRALTGLLAGHNRSHWKWQHARG